MYQMKRFSFVVLFGVGVLAFSTILIYSQGKSPKKGSQDGQINNQNNENDFGVDESLQKKIDTATEAGAAYLISQIPNILSEKHEDTHHRYDELVLLALIHSNAFRQEEPHKNESIVNLLNRVLEYDLKFTYNVSLQTMALEKLNKISYQERLQKCATFLVNTQCENGQWSYKAKDKYSIKGDDAVCLKDVKCSDRVPKIQKVIVEIEKHGKESGDNSNTQFAALALWSCLNAKIQVPENVLVSAKEFWEKDQNSDGGWGYPHQGGDKATSRATMTAAGISSLAIYDYWWLQYREKNNKHVQNGINCLSDMLNGKDALFNKEVKKGAPIPGYLLYSIERAAVLARVKNLGTTKKLGNYDWYKAGASALVLAQNDDGSWNCSGVGTDKDGTNLNASKIQGTSFALLFLKKAIKPLKPIEEK